MVYQIGSATKTDKGALVGKIKENSNAKKATKMVTVAREVFLIFSTPLFDQRDARGDTRVPRGGGRSAPQANPRSATDL